MKLTGVLADGLLDLLWPRSCFGCGVPLSGGSGLLHLCGRCAGSIDLILGHACPRCGSPHRDDNRGRPDCGCCRGRDFAFRSCRCLFEFCGLGRRIIHELKYRCGHHLLPDVGRLSRLVFGDLAGGVLVPVPLHWRRRWGRGFNQSALICGALAREHGCEVRHLLRRRRNTESQVGLGREWRRRNVEGAFVLAPGLPWKKTVAKGRKIFLVDDVLTTGATLDACARVLVEAGHGEVHALALAHG
jgi:ComF family protein